ncbi:hypothetical protein GOBAR_DD33724 [Gossypium barbadense]|nr:hypothetical protein GOBAR_DD33724 [Gossypium barbadense]
MGSLINNNNHISSTINEMGPYRALRGRVNSVGFQPDECLIPYLELAGWSTNPGIEKSPSVPIYRLMIENHAGEEFIWMPYSAPKIMAVMPSSARYIPTLPVQLGEIHGMSKKGRCRDNWEEVHEEYITI